MSVGFKAYRLTETPRNELWDRQSDIYPSIHGPTTQVEDLGSIYLPTINRGDLANALPSRGSSRTTFHRDVREAALNRPTLHSPGTFWNPPLYHDREPYDDLRTGLVSLPGSSTNLLADVRRMESTNEGVGEDMEAHRLIPNSSSGALASDPHTAILLISGDQGSRSIAPLGTLIDHGRDGRVLSVRDSRPAEVIPYRISPEELITVIHRICVTADLDTLTKKGVRKQLEQEFGVELLSRKDEINRAIEQVLSSRS